MNHFQTSRRVAILLIVAAMLAVPCLQRPCSADRQPFLLGADLSMLKVDEDAGVVYRDHGRSGDCIQIFKQHGWNMVRLRLWVHPSGQNGMVCDLGYVGALARRAKAAGMKFYLDIHYSDTWADAGNQKKPAAWANDTFDTPSKLYEDVYWYTSNVLYTLAHTYHAAPDYVSIGNEVTYGMLWPDGYLGAVKGTWSNWTKYATLVNKGIQGAQRGAHKAGMAMPKFIIHISFGPYWNVVNGFFSGLTSARDITGQPVRFDIIGLSYYPNDKTDLSDIKGVLANCAQKFGKPILLCETAYQYRGTDSANSGLYPQTPAGQAAYLSDLVTAVKNTPDGLGLGLCYWEPEALPNPVTDAYAYGSWRDSGWSALFDTQTGEAEPGIAAAGASAAKAK